MRVLWAPDISIMPFISLQFHDFAIVNVSISSSCSVPMMACQFPVYDKNMCNFLMSPHVFH